MGALCAAGSLLSACATAVASRQPGTLVVVYSADANTLNPLFANNEPASLFYDFIFDGLTGYGKTSRLRRPWRPRSSARASAFAPVLGLEAAHRNG